MSQEGLMKRLYDSKGLALHGKSKQSLSDLKLLVVSNVIHRLNLQVYFYGVVVIEKGLCGFFRECN